MLKTSQTSQKEIAKGIIQIHNVIDLIDDGYHQMMIYDLTKISNFLFDELSPENQEKCKKYFESRNTKKEA